MGNTLNGFLAGLGVAGIITMGVVTIRDEIKKVHMYQLQDRNLEERVFVNPSEFSAMISGSITEPQTIATYKGTDYLFKIGTNGIPYLEPLKVKDKE